MEYNVRPDGVKFKLYQGQYLIDVKKSRIIKDEELGLQDYNVTFFNISQDEEYLILGCEDFNKNEVFIIRIGSLSDFFYFSPIKLEAVLHLKDMF
jgi:hypothetical protein